MKENDLSDSQGNHLPFRITDRHRLLTSFVHKVLLNANRLPIFPPLQTVSFINAGVMPSFYISKFSNSWVK